jgi:hypothetical protein
MFEVSWTGCGLEGGGGDKYKENAVFGIALVAL